jgi:hypothetical protein
MEILERYLQAVGQHLPAKGKDDTLAELRENLLAQMEGREEELGRPLTEAEVAAVVEAHGRPVLVAARYLPQQYLIGPSLFPIYWITLKRSFPVMVLVYVATQCALLIFEGPGAFRLGAAIGHLPSVILIFWAVLTAGFAMFELMQGRYFATVKMPSGWNVKDLPPLSSPDKAPSLAGRVADVMITALTAAWLLSIPYLPWVFIGPGARNLRGLQVGLTPEWHIFYWQLMGLLLASLALKAVLIFDLPSRLRQGLQLAVKMFGILGLVVLVQARLYFVPAGLLPTHNLDALTAINTSINLGFKIVLVVALLNFLWDLWKLATETDVPRAGCAVI